MNRQRNEDEYLLMGIPQESSKNFSTSCWVVFFRLGIGLRSRVGEKPIQRGGIFAYENSPRIFKEFFHVMLGGIV